MRISQTVDVKPRLVKMTWEEAYDGTIGGCTDCGETQDSVEPDAQHYKCGSCGGYNVFGAEQLAAMGLIDIGEE